MGVKFTFKEYVVIEHHYRVGKSIHNTTHSYQLKILNLGGSKRGLSFEKGEQGVYFTGKISKGTHDEKYYRNIAQQIWDQSQNGENWPDKPIVRVQSGGSQIEEAWTKRGKATFYLRIRSQTDVDDE